VLSVQNYDVLLVLLFMHLCMPCCVRFQSIHRNDILGNYFSGCCSGFIVDHMHVGHVEQLVNYVLGMPNLVV